MASKIMERNAAINGSAKSCIGRQGGPDRLSLTLGRPERNAEAGLNTADIDGVLPWPGRGRRRSAHRRWAGQHQGVIKKPQAKMDIPRARGERPAYSRINAVMAVVYGKGAARVVYRTLMEARATGPGIGRAAPRGAGLDKPFHAYGEATSCPASLEYRSTTRHEAGSSWRNPDQLAPQRQSQSKAVLPRGPLPWRLHVRALWSPRLLPLDCECPCRLHGADMSPRVPPRNGRSRRCSSRTGRSALGRRQLGPETT